MPDLDQTPRPAVPADPLGEARRELTKLLHGATSVPAVTLVRLIEQLIDQKFVQFSDLVSQRLREDSHRGKSGPGAS